MLARYRMIRGRRPDTDPLPQGIRQDTRRHTRHCLRPTKEMVERYLQSPTEREWQRYASDYLALLECRYREDRDQFDRLAALATENDVFLGCSCPTKKNPDIRRCHTVLALGFMKAKYPCLEVRLPG